MTESPRPARRTIPLIDVAGPPYQRGFQFGRACGDLLRRYPAALRRVMVDEARLRDPLASVSELDDDELCRRALLFLPWFERFDPTQVEEIQGVAAGAEVPFGMALLANVRAEVAGIGRFAGDQTLAVSETARVSRTDAAEGCTGIAVGRAGTADGSVLIGQNQDQHPAMEDLVVVLRVEPEEGPRMLMATFPGLLAYGGINSAGIGYMMNALANSTWRMGLPHYPVKRALMRQSDLSGCVRAFDGAPVGSCANNLLVDRDGVADLESTPDGYEVVRPRPGEPFLVHTNHFLSPRLAVDEQLLPKLPDSAVRLKLARARLTERAGRITLDDLKATFAGHAEPIGICRHADPARGNALKTIFSVIGEPDHGRLHVCLGNPCAGEYQTFSL